jgi:hypothetical protein
MLSTTAIHLLLLACTPTGPGFGGGGEQQPDAIWEGSSDTAELPLHDDDLLDCMGRGDVDAISGASPPDIQGFFSVSGQLVASDSDYPDGSTTSGSLCISDQTGDGSIAVRESATLSETTSSWGEIHGLDGSFSLWLELEGDDPHDADCVVRSVSVVSGTVVGEDLELSTATVPLEYQDCEAYDPATIGSCWATEATATRTGECS